MLQREPPKPEDFTIVREGPQRWRERVGRVREVVRMPTPIIQAFQPSRGIKVPVSQAPGMLAADELPAWEVRRQEPASTTAAHAAEGLEHLPRRLMLQHLPQDDHVEAPRPGEHPALAADDVCCYEVPGCAWAEPVCYAKTAETFLQTRRQLWYDVGALVAHRWVTLEPRTHPLEVAAHVPNTPECTHLVQCLHRTARLRGAGEVRPWATAATPHIAGVNASERRRSLRVLYNVRQASQDIGLRQWHCSGVASASLPTPTPEEGIAPHSRHAF
mmetsp:Transcript_32300/g.89211  ORF Transcript_32300/g.89211 Transcript_32300/m.89211 type:complete len:273 (-) Transcript_32300:192-1010(-)